VSTPLAFALALLGDPAQASPPVLEAEDDEAREIVVEVERDTASATVLDAAELAAAPIRTAEDALRLAPGMVLVQHGAEGKGQQYFLRGFDAVHGIDFEVEVDGVPLNEWSNIHAQGYLDLGMLIPELIERVELLPGPFALGQGPFALAGSARFSLGVPEADRGLRASVGFGSTLRRRMLLSYSPREGDGSRFIAAELMSDPGFGQSRDSRRAVIMARQVLVDRPRGRLGALVIGQAGEFGLPGANSWAEYEAGRVGFWGAHDHGRGEARRAQLALDGELFGERQHARVVAWSGYRKLALLENFTGVFEEPERGDRRLQHHRAVPFGLRVDHRVSLGRRVALDSGLGVRGDVFEQSEQRVDLSARPFELTREAAAVQANPWLYSGVRWQVHPSLMLAAGARADAFVFSVRDGRAPELEPATGVRFAASPRANLRWSVISTLDLFAAYGRGVRPPEARAFTTHDPERFGPIAERLDEGPRVSASDSGELGMRWHPRPWFDLRVAGFATYLARESIYDHVSRTNLQLAATRRLGAAGDLRVQPKPWLGVAGSLTWVDARFVASRNLVPLAPSLVASLRAWLAHPLGARAGLLLVGWAPRPLPHGARGSALARLDATTGWHLERVRVDLVIENVLGLRLREGEYYFASNFRPGEAGSQLPTLHYVPGPPLNARVMVSVLW
jgi:iron complex outermembrane recepter protein